MERKKRGKSLREHSRTCSSRDGTKYNAVGTLMAPNTTLLAFTSMVSGNTKVMVSSVMSEEEGKKKKRKREHVLMYKHILGSIFFTASSNNNGAAFLGEMVRRVLAKSGCCASNEAHLAGVPSRVDAYVSSSFGISVARLLVT